MRGVKEHIQNRLRRISGASGEARQKMAASQPHEQWWVRCWHCKKTITARHKDLEEMGHCPHCGVNLHKRDASAV